MRKSEKWSLLVVSDSATGWTVAYQAPLSMGFSRQGYWSGLPFPALGNLPNPGIKPMSTHIVGRRFTVWVTREACIEMRKGLSWAQRVYMCTSVCTSVHMCACVHTCIHVCLDKDCTEGEEQTKGLFIFASLYPISSCNLFFSGYLYMLSRFSCVRLFASWWAVACQAPLSMGFSGQECWSGLPCPPPRGLPNPGIKPMSLALHLLHWQVGSLPLVPAGKAVVLWLQV